MHQGVLTNAAYMKFAAKSTVEVICMQDTDEALQMNDPQVKTYKTKDAYGDEVEYVRKFPGLTLEQVRDLGTCDALQYMEGPKMPATVIVDPHTLKKMGGIPRAQRRAAGFIKAIQPFVDALKKRHGPGIDRTVWNRVAAAGTKSDLLLADNKIAEAMKLYRDLEKVAAPHQKELASRLDALRGVIETDAAKRLDELEKLITNSTREQKSSARERRSAARELKKLASALKGTKLEQRAVSLLAIAKGS